MGRFNLSHHHALAEDMGYLIPACTHEVLPGDNWNHSTSVLMRIAPLAQPIMHEVHVGLHHFYVPNRIVDPDFENWIVGESVTDNPRITHPGTSALMDHMGIPNVAGIEIDARPIRAYNLIYNEWYRDQHLQTERTQDDTSLARLCWEKDYLTTARAQPEQGGAIDINFSSGQAPIRTQGATGTVNISAATDAPNDLLVSRASADPFYTDLSSATGGININDLRTSLALQKFSEARAAFGTRFTDYLRYLGVRPSDSRLQRPEFLGGGSTIVNFSEVLATAEGTSTSVGDLFGHGISALRTKNYRRYFEEHGWVITLLHVRPKTVYQDRLPKQFYRHDPMDVWQRELEALPWQEIDETEVYAAGTAGNVWGYAPRYDEYRTTESYVSGSFRTTDDDWHYARQFTSTPTLNGSFVECTPTDRVYGDNTMPEIYASVRNNIRASRLVAQRSALAGDSNVNLL